MSYVNGEFHVIYPAGNNLYDSWKTYNNGVGTWTQTIIEYNPVSGSDWSPQLTRYGNELYLFYLRVVGIDMNNIFYRKWNSSSQTWSSATQLTFDNNNVRYPQGPAIVPVSSSVIPLAWSKDATIWYDSIPVSGTPTVSLDVNSDGKINIIDLAITTFWQGKNNGQGDWNLFQHIDLDSDGKVSFTDVLRVITGM